MANLYFVRVDEDWTRSATLSATSEQTGYEADMAQTDDPGEPWWASSGSATLTVNLGASREVGLVALIMTNADHGRAITVGGLTGVSLTGRRAASGYPIDLVAIVDPPQTVSSVTFAISGNSNNWSIGRVVVGRRRELAGNFLDGFTPEPFRPQYEDAFPVLGHDIRYDLGVERWKCQGDVILTRSQQATLDDWWSSTLSGFHPTLLVPDATLYPPFFMRMTMGLPRKHDSRHVRTALSFVDVSRGIEVVD